MGAFSDTYENKVLEAVVGKTALPAVSAYVALFTVAPTDSAAGTEVTGGAYARLATVATDWNAASAGQITNAVDFAWATATADWGSVVAVALMDAATGGNVIAYGNASTAKAITTGDSFRIQAGSFTLSLD